MIEHEKNPWDLTELERIALAKKMKETGNKYFLDGMVEEALERYRSGLKRLIPLWDLSAEQLSEIENLKLLLYLNIAACKMKLGMHDHAAENCSKALSIDNRNIKALYRRAIAWTEINEFEKAQEDINAGLLLDENNKALKSQQEIIRDRFREQTHKYDAMLKKCFSG